VSAVEVLFLPMHEDSKLVRGIPAAIAAKVAALVFFKKSLLFQLIFIRLYLS
jgi:hypothetical protein